MAKKKLTRKATPKKKITKKKISKAKSPAKAKTKSVTAQVVVGRKVPAFAALATGEQTIALKDLAGHAIVLYFYPKDSTPGCTLEGRDFSAMKTQFEKMGAKVFGISRDTLKSHENFKRKENYSIDLISDPDEKLCALFGVIKMKNMYGRQVRGIERSTFVIGQDGTLVKEWRGVKVPGHAQAVYEFVTTL